MGRVAIAKTFAGGETGLEKQNSGSLVPGEVIGPPRGKVENHSAFRTTMDGDNKSRSMRNNIH